MMIILWKKKKLEINFDKNPAPITTQNHNISQCQGVLSLTINLVGPRAAERLPRQNVCSESESKTQSKTSKWTSAAAKKKNEKKESYNICSWLPSGKSCSSFLMSILSALGSSLPSSPPQQRRRLHQTVVEELRRRPGMINLCHS